MLDHEPTADDAAVEAVDTRSEPHAMPTALHLDGAYGEYGPVAPGAILTGPDDLPLSPERGLERVGEALNPRRSLSLADGGIHESFRLPPEVQTAIFLDLLLDRVPKGMDLHAYIWSLGTKRSTPWRVGDPYPAALTNPAQRPIDTYIGTTLTRGPVQSAGRATKQTAGAVMAVVADIDIYHEDFHKHENLPTTQEEAIDLLNRMPLTPSAVVWSGYGLQGWWMLDETLVITDPAAAEAVTMGWQRVIQGEASKSDWHTDTVGDLARILRLPGTLNGKDRGSPKSAVLLTATGSRYRVEDIEEVIAATPSQTKAPTSSTRVRASQLTPTEFDFDLDADAEIPTAWGDLAQRHPRAMRSFNHERDDLLDQSASAYDMSLASIAVQDGWKDQAIVDLLINHRRHHGHNLKTNRPDYYARTIEHARLTSDDDYEEPTNPFLDLMKLYGVVPVLADHFEDDHHVARDRSGVLYLWQNGVYRPWSDGCETWVRSTLEGWLATSKWTANLPTNLTAYLRANAPLLDEHPGFKYLNVANGLLDLSTRELLPHTPDHLSVIQLPVSYYPEAQCPAWERFVTETFPEDAQAVAWEIFAFVMVPDPSIQKAILLIGSGGNGKSVYLRGLQGFLGQENYSTEPLHRIEANRFAAVRLEGMLANIAADLPSSDLEGSSTFKGIIGGDAISVERKFRDAFDLRPYARLIFSTNAPPRTPDASPAFFARWIVIPFDRSFRGEATEIPSRELDRRLHSPTELSGVLNLALSALSGIQERGISESLSMLTAKDEFRRATDPLSVWLETATVVDSSAMVPKDNLRDAYNGYAAAEGLPTLTAQAFGRALRQVRPSIQPGQRVIRGTRREVWTGIGLRDTDASIGLS